MQSRTSLMDRQAKKLQSVREEGRYEDMDTFVDNENETAKEVSLGESKDDGVIKITNHDMIRIFSLEGTLN